MHSPINFRTMNPADIAAGLELCRAARWNQTERDWELFLNLSPRGCRVAVKDQRVIGTVATVRYEDRFSWVGMVLVDPAERGRGVGARQLVAACLSRQTGKRFILDASHHEADWRAWLESIGFCEQRPFIRMFYRNNPFPGLPPKQFGILGPEFG